MDCIARQNNLGVGNMDVMYATRIEEEKKQMSKKIAELAVNALIQEVKLTPKPGLVDRLDNGSHDDLTVDLMVKSATTLQRTFERIAYASFGRDISQSLREEIALIGREGEHQMFAATNGVNTHKGAIWALGLITSAFASNYGKLNSYEVLKTAGEIASYQDRQYADKIKTNGNVVQQKYGIRGAREEAENGFPSLYNYALPVFEKNIDQGKPLESTLHLTLLHLMMHVDDTCVLHRAGKKGLHFAQKESEKILDLGVTEERLLLLNEQFIDKNISPGGCADLLAATIFLHLLKRNFSQD